MYDAEDQGTDGTLDGLLLTLLAVRMEYPGTTPLVMSKDAEGNSYSPWADVTIGRYKPCSTWDGEFHGPDIHEEDPCDDDCGDAAVCLGPVN